MKSDYSVTSSGKAESPSRHRAAHYPPEKEVQDTRQQKACREFKSMPAEYQNPLAFKDGLAPNKLAGPT